MHALSHSHDSVTLFLSSACGLHCVLPPSLPPPTPPPPFYHYTIPLSLSHPNPFSLSPSAHLLVPAVILTPPPSRWCIAAGRARERERARELVCVRVCVESALSLSCGQMEDGATATSLLVFCAACHRLKGALTLSVFSSIHSPVPELALICDGLSKKKD